MSTPNEMTADTPVWATELMDTLGEDSSTVDVIHRQAEARFLVRLLTEQPPDVWQDWAQSADTPMWMRTCIVEYSVAASKWEQIRQVADLEFVGDEVLEDLLIDEEDA